MTAVLAQPTPTLAVANETNGMTKFAQELLSAPEIDGPLAVLDFEVTGGASRIGKLLAAQLSESLHQKIRVLEPVKVRETLHHETLPATGFPEPVELKQLAQSLGARQIVIGTATCIGNKALIHAYVVVPATENIIARAQTIARCP